MFFPHLINNNIRKVIQLGDIFDNRKHANLQGLSEYKRYFFDKFEEYDIEMTVLGEWYDGMRMEIQDRAVGKEEIHE